MKNTIKILVSAFIVAASASSFVGSANSASMKMSKDDMMAMKPMMCKMHGMGTETYACFSEPMAKQMMMKKHLKMHSMMCKQSGMGTEQYDCLTNSKYKTMMKHM